MYAQTDRCLAFLNFFENKTTQLLPLMSTFCRGSGFEVCKYNCIHPLVSFPSSMAFEYLPMGVVHGDLAEHTVTRAAHPALVLRPDRETGD